MQDEQRRQAEQQRATQHKTEQRRKQGQEKQVSDRGVLPHSEDTPQKQEQERKQEKTPQSQEVRDLANTQKYYESLIKSGYYDEQRAEKGERTEPKKELTPVERLHLKHEAMKGKVEKKLEERSKGHEKGGHER